MTEEPVTRVPIEHAPAQERLLEVRVSNLIARVAGYLATLSSRPSREVAEQGEALVTEIEALRSTASLAGSIEKAEADDPERAWAAGVLHGLSQVLTEYRQQLGTEGEGPSVGPDVPLCTRVARQLFTMDFAASWKALRSERRSISKESETAASRYMEGVIEALRAMIRAVEIRLEQIVLDDLQPTDDVRPRRDELLTLLFIALTRSSRPRAQRALGRSYDDRLMDGLVKRGLVTTDEPGSSQITTSGATRARKLLAAVA